jgi:AraC family cel operon transcriptional repressor
MTVQKFTHTTVMQNGAESFLSPVNSIKYASPIHCHDFYKFFLITKGRAVHVVNNKRQPIAEGTLVFIRPADVHYYEHEENLEYEFINVCFTKSAVSNTLKFLDEAFSNDYLLSPLPPPCISLSLLEKGHLVHRLESIYTLSKEDMNKWKILLRGVLVEVLLSYFSQLQTSQKNDLPIWMESLLLQMQKKRTLPRD